MNFVDTEMLKKIEDAHSGSEWHKWEPRLTGSERFQGLRPGIVTKQTFVSPSLGIFSFLYDNETDFINLDLQSAVT